MIDAYYTPKLKDFQNGLEYEHFMETLNSWIPETFHLNKAHIDIIKYVDIEDENTVRKVRIRNLNREDFRLLGFNTEDNGETFQDSILFDLWTIAVFENNNFSISKNLETRFIGEIKNKLELEKVLIQIGYGK